MLRFKRDRTVPQLKIPTYVRPLTHVASNLPQIERYQFASGEKQSAFGESDLAQRALDQIQANRVPVTSPSLRKDKSGSSAADQ